MPRNSRAHSPLTAAILLTLLAALCVQPVVAAPGDVETVILFDSIAMETPESIVVDAQGNIFIGSAFTAEIFKLAPDGTLSVHAQLPVAAVGAPCEGSPLPAILGALTLGKRGRRRSSRRACLACRLFSVP